MATTTVWAHFCNSGSIEPVNGLPYQMNSDDFVAELVRVIHKEFGVSATRYGQVMLDGQVIPLDRTLNLLTTTCANPIYITPSPLAPPLITPPSSIGDKFVDRECLKLTDLITQMEKTKVAIVGPKGVGKSTLLIEAYHKARGMDKNCLYFDLSMVEDDRYKDCKCHDDDYVFMDNAQRLRSEEFKHVPAMVSSSKRCLAFSSSCFDNEGGIADQKCCLRYNVLVTLLPFSQEEVNDYLHKLGSAHTFNRDTTLPDVICKCVCSGQDISKTYEDVLYRTISDVVGRLLSRMQSSAHLLTSLYYMCLLGKDEYVKQLHVCNLVYFEHGEYKLVYDRSILTKYLTESAKQHHAQMLQYDVGGANELLFNQSCRLGPISLQCFGVKPLALRGRTQRHSTITVTCTDFVVQLSIGECVPPPSARTCVLIKLALNHPAIDFLIVDNTYGTVSAKTIYFIQVSGSRYQDRGADKKYDAVFNNFSHFVDPPYLRYTKMFNIKYNNAYFVYSSPSIPSNKSFSTKECEQNRIYFNQLLI